MVVRDDGDGGCAIELLMLQQHYQCVRVVAEVGRRVGVGGRCVAGAGGQQCQA